MSATIQLEFRHGVTPLLQPTIRIYSNASLSLEVTCIDSDGSMDLSGGAVAASARRPDGFFENVAASIADPVAGTVTLSASGNTFGLGRHVVQVTLALGGLVLAAQLHLDVSAGIGETPVPATVAPSVIGSIDPVSVEEGTPVPPVDLTTVFDQGSPPAVLTLQEPVAGLSIVGTELRFDTSAPRTSSAFTVTATNTAGSANVASSFEVTAAAAPVAPSVIGSISPVSVEEGTPVAPVDLTTVFDLGTPTANLAFQAPVDGLSIVGTELRFDTSAVRASAAFTVVATNTVDSVSVPSSFEVTAASVGGNSHTASVSDFGTDEIVFDTGSAFGRDQATIPITVPLTSAPDGTDIEARAILASDGTTVVENWKVIGQASGNSCNGSFTATQAAGGDDWLLLEVRVVGSDQAPARMTTRCDIGFVVAVLGQSELDRLFITGGGSYTGTFAPTAQFPVVVGNATYTPDIPGNPVTGFTATKGFIATGSGVAVKMQHYADAWLKNGVTRKVKTIDLTQSAHGRFQLSDDAEPNRRWADLIACLNAAGWADGVRPGVIIDMWTNADVIFATDFLKAYKPFYTGRNADGTDYTLGTGFSVETFSGTPGTDDRTIKHDHILFDLTGRGLGLFDEAVTKIVLCHHRYDPNATDQQNALFNTSNDVVTDMWAQEIIRKAYDGLLADADLSQIMVRGTEPMNYENGTEVGGTWGDQIHPGQGPDGLQLFARHVAHAAMRACGVVSATIPEFDTVSFDPAGAYADFSWSGGNITTTRKLRGLADPSPAPGPHWTDVFGFEFNDQPVERAELQPNGSVRVYVPAAAAPADWSRDRFFFGRGGGSGVLLQIADPLEGAWLNYPVVDAASLSVAGMYDDTAQSAGGIAVRPLRALPSDLAAPDAFRAAAVNTQEAWFRDPNGISVAAGGDATQLHAELEMAFHSTQHLVRLMGIADDVDFFINRSLEGRTMLWAGGGSATAATFTPSPGVRYLYKLVVDRVANTLRAYANDELIIDDSLGGTATKFINGAQINVLGNVDAADGTFITPDAEFVSFRCWVNQNVGDPGDSTPATAPHKEILASSGVAALDADPWRQAGGAIVPFDQAPAAPAQPGQIDISSEQEMRDFLGVAKTNPTAVAGADVVLAPGLDLKGIQADDWANAFIWSADRAPITVRSADPANPALLFGVMMRPWLTGDGSITGNVRWKDIQFDFTHIPLMPPEWGNVGNLSRHAFESNRGNEMRDCTFEGCRWVGSFNEARIDNRDAQFRQIGIVVPWSTRLQILDCRFERINTGFVVAGEHILIDNVRTRHAWEDLGRLSTQHQNGMLADTRFVTVRRVVFWDAWSRHQLHPDAGLQVDHFFNLTDPVEHGFADITDVLIEYCIYFPGVQIFQPAQPSGYGPVSQVMWDTMPVEGAHMEPLKMNRFRVSGSFVLPEGVPIGWKTAIQIEGSVDPTPVVTFSAPGGAVMTWHMNADDPTTSYTLDRKAETVEVRFDADGYSLDPKRGGSNWLQTNFNDNGTKRRWTVRKCIIWGTTPNGVSIQSNSEDFVVEDCTLLRPLPGDTTGNGRANTPKDGYSVMNHPRVIKRGTPESATIRRTVASALFRDSGADTNNFEMGYNDLTDLRANYNVEDSGDGVRHYPTTIAEAISMARPKPGSYIATNGIGALSADPADDAAGWEWATAA